MGGVAKTVLEVGDISVEKVQRIASTLKRPGHWAPLAVHGEPRAAVLWPCWEALDPLVVSAGHLLSLPTAAKLTAAVCRLEVAEPVRQADLLGRAAVKRWMAGEPLADMRILSARTHRKGVELSVLPVIRNLLARREAQKLGEDWVPVESRRQRRQRNSTERDGLLAVPGVSRVSVQDRKMLKYRQRKVAAASPRKPKQQTFEADAVQPDLSLDDTLAFPSLTGESLRCGATCAKPGLETASWHLPNLKPEDTADGRSEAETSTKASSLSDAGLECFTQTVTDIPDSWESLDAG